MKIAHLLAGVAAVTLVASAANAQDIHRGQSSVTQLFGNGYIRGNNPTNLPTNTGNFLQNIANGLTNAANAGENIAANVNNAVAQDGSSNISAWHAIGDAAADVGTASGNDGATFTIKGTISTDCAYYSGDNTTETFDFGTLGIYASDQTGPASAFEMVNDANLTINTNLAGCNTNNSVTLSRTTADLQNPNSSGFDNTVFRDTLPYSVTARYTGSVYNNNVGSAPQARVQTLAAGVTNSVQQNGAWRSPMALEVVIPVQPLAILAGEYTGSFSVTLQAI